MTFKLIKTKQPAVVYKDGEYFTCLKPENGHTVGLTYRIRGILDNNSRDSAYNQAIYSYHNSSATDEKHIRRATDTEIDHYCRFIAQTESHFDDVYS